MDRLQLTNASLETVSLLGKNLLSGGGSMHTLLSYGIENGILGGPLQAIHSLSVNDNCLQVAGSLVQNETILRISTNYGAIFRKV